MSYGVVVLLETELHTWFPWKHICQIAIMDQTRFQKSAYEANYLPSRSVKELFCVEFYPILIIFHTAPKILLAYFLFFFSFYCLVSGAAETTLQESGLSCNEQLCLPTESLKNMKSWIFENHLLMSLMFCRGQHVQLLACPLSYTCFSKVLYPKGVNNLDTDPTLCIASTYGLS